MTHFFRKRVASFVDLDSMKEMKDPGSNRSRNNVKSYLTKTFGKNSDSLVKCLVCERTSYLDDCKKKMEKDVEERSKRVGKKKLCHGCLLGISKKKSARTCSKKLKYVDL